jgi:hypothetical protein
MVGGVASKGPWSLVKLLDDIWSEFGHPACHLQDHLAALLGAYAGKIVLSPGPYVLQESSVPLSSHGGFPVMGPEIRHAVIVGVLLPSAADKGRNDTIS